VPKSYWVGSQYILGVMIDRFQGGYQHCFFCSFADDSNF
jgi:hypothetical protein